MEQVRINFTLFFFEKPNGYFRKHFKIDSRIILAYELIIIIFYGLKFLFCLNLYSKWL